MRKKGRPKIKLSLYLPEEVALHLKEKSYAYGWELSSYVSFLIQNSEYYKKNIIRDHNE